MKLVNKSYAAYDEKGEIIGSVYCSEEMVELMMQINGFTQWIEVPGPVRGETDYIVNGEVVLRPEMGSTSNGATLIGVLEGSTVTVEGQAYTADGTNIELEFTSPGLHIVKVTLWPYVKQEFYIENPA